MILQKLSIEQNEAVFDENNILLTAIPGSGKTRTLTNKVLKELQEEKDGMVIAITYTRRAANEIKERIYEILGESPKKLWIGTIHSFCLEFVIRKYGSFSETISKPFKIIGDDERDKLLKNLKNKYNINEFAKIDMTLDVNGKPNNYMYYNFVEEYYEYLLQNRMVDFNYILYETYSMLIKSERIRNNLSNIIRVICIDEYQDTQELQYQILGLLTNNKTDKNIFVVGDVNQAIYSGIGGVIKNKNELEKIFGRPFIERNLTGCYRSNQEIIDLYKNFCCEKHMMISMNKQYNKPIIHIDANITKKNLIPEIANIISDLIDNHDIPPEEICVIAPQWYMLFDFSNKIRELLPNVPFDAPGIIPLKKDEESIIYKISEILLTNFSFNNRYYLERLADEVIKQFEEEYSIDLRMTPKEFLNLCYEAKKSDKNIATEYLEESLFIVFQKLHIEDIFKEDIYNFIQGTIDRIKKYEKNGIEDDRMFFEKSLRSKKGIVVSTAHGVKGEEYRVIIAFALLYGFVPHWDTIFNNSKGAETEAKKLLYVICSRAKEKLFLFAESGRTNGRGNEYTVTPELLKLIKND
jgi:superfamily I DNA/RNA helicase